MNDQHTTHVVPSSDDKFRDSFMRMVRERNNSLRAKYPHAFPEKKN